MSMSESEEVLLRRIMEAVTPVITPIAQTDWTNPRDIIHKGNQAMTEAAKPLTPFSDNPNRAERCHQLVTTIADVQNECTRISAEMDKAHIRMRAAIKKLTAANKLPSIETLKQSLSAKFTAQEQKELEGLISAVRKFSQVATDTLQVSMFLYTLSSGVATGEALIAGVKAILNSQVVAKISASFKSGAAGGTTAAAGIEKEVASAMEGEVELREAAAVTQEVSKLTRVMRAISRIARGLGELGFALIAIDMVIQVVVGQQQKDKLIQGIHQAQVARLLTYYVRREAQIYEAHLLDMTSYMERLDSGDQPVARYLGKNLIKGVKSEIDELKLTTLEDELKRQDASHENIYLDDDLPHSEVVKLAENHKDQPV